MFDAPKITILITFLAVLGLPFLFRNDSVVPPESARQLIVITPHNEQIRFEFEHAFETYHADEFGEPVDLIWSVPGGTSEIRRMLEAQFESALEAGDQPGGEADIVFGGGSYEHGALKRGVEVEVGGETKKASITQPGGLSDEELQRLFGDNEVGGGPLYDPQGHWYGSALSFFGIVFNRDLLTEHQLEEPEGWESMTHPGAQGLVALVNPAQSGSVKTAFEAILTRLGWVRGWQVLRRAGANARYFSASSLRAPSDVSQGEAAMGVCIDFYGRYQSQAVQSGGGGRRVGYIDPPGETQIDPDPISMLANPRDEELARRFIEFVLSDAGQALWQMRPDNGSPLGPIQFELRRMPVRRSFYGQYMEMMVDQIDPFLLARPPEFADSAKRSFITPLFGGMVMDTHELLSEAWAAITSHPAYPDTIGIVTADDVGDPQLKAMLQDFDAIIEIPGPDGVSIPLDTPRRRAQVKAGWLRGGWSDAMPPLWPWEADPAQAMRSLVAKEAAANYHGVITTAAGEQP